MVAWMCELVDVQFVVWYAPTVPVLRSVSVGEPRFLRFVDEVAEDLRPTLLSPEEHGEWKGTQPAIVTTRQLHERLHATRSDADE